MNGGLVRLREVLNSLRPSERKVADYILKFPDKVIGLSVAKLAEFSGSSQATIIRLCSQIGTAGYQDLKVRIAVDLQDIESPGYKEITPQDPVESIIHKISHNNIHSIRDSLKILDADMVKQSIEIGQSDYYEKRSDLTSLP